jgi:hypothetical protein
MKRLPDRCHRTRSSQNLECLLHLDEKILLATLKYRRRKRGFLKTVLERCEAALRLRKVSIDHRAEQVVRELIVS